MDECLIVPVIEDGEPFGLLVLCRAPENSFSEQDIQMAESLIQEAVPELKAGIVFAQTLQHAAVAQILFDVQQSLAHVLDSNVIGQMVVDQARKLVRSRFALFFGYRGKDLCLSYAAGLETQESDYKEQIERAMMIAEKATRSGGPVRCTTNAPNMDSMNDRESAILVAIPLSSEARPIGVLVVAEIWPTIIGQDEEKVLLKLAAATSVALSNALILEQAKYVAALEERAKLSQEFHDQLAQDLVYLKLQVHTAQNKASHEVATETSAALKELACALEGTYAQVRNGIFDLRRPISSTDGFVESLKEYLKEFGDRYDIEGMLEIDSDWHPDWPPETEVQVVRIIQEALNNVRQHAGPCQVRIRLDGGSQCKQINIVDNGTGFDLAAMKHKGNDHFGLAIMQDRASSFDGHVDLTSSIGVGTTLTIRIPEHN
jgi:signal transduction histidine kinase